MEKLPVEKTSEDMQSAVDHERSQTLSDVLHLAMLKIGMSSFKAMNFRLVGFPQSCW